MRRWVLLLCASALGGILGCANRALVRFDAISKQTAAQDFLAAAERIRKERSSLYGSHSEFLYRLDLGLLYHYAGKYDSSVVYLAEAVKVYDDLFTRSVTNEAASLVTNDNLRPYRGRPYEVTWLHLFLAFDYLALERYDDARVEVRQAQIFLDEVKRKAGSDRKTYRDDGLFRAVAALIYEALGEKDDALISLYQSVKAYREAGTPVPPGLARRAAALLSANDRKNDVQELELPETGATAEDASFGGSEIVVVGEMGRSPAVGETVFWGTWVKDGVLVFHYKNAEGREITDALPAPGLPPRDYGNPRNGRRPKHTRSGTSFHLKWAMPALREIPSQSDLLLARQGNISYRGESYADSRDLLKQDMDATFGSTLTRTVVRVAARTVASEEAKSQLNSGNPLLNLLANIGIDVLGDQLEKADTRACFLFPRRVQILRIPAPPGHYSLTLDAQHSSGQAVRSETREVDVKPGQKKFVFFPSLK